MRHDMKRPSFFEKMLGFPIEQRVTTGVATIHTEEPDMNINIPASQNDAWGFWGSMNEHAAAAWPLAITTIHAETEEDPEVIRAFLDSRHGRHFGDEVLDRVEQHGDDLHAAIDIVVRRWQRWSIDARTSREYGIPKGLPYLTGFVIHCGICDEMAA